MKRVFVTLIAIIALTGFLAAANVEVGFMYGLRTMSDSAVKDAYGNGGVFYPYVDVKLVKGFTLGLGYEGGYSKDADIGQFQDASTLKVSGFELFAAYQFCLKKVQPYIKAGVGFYKYEQSVVGFSDKVDDNKAGMVLAGGVKFYPSKGFFLSAEVKYVPLKVQPLDVEVDLGGLRLSAGIGYSFGK